MELITSKIPKGQQAHRAIMEAKQNLLGKEPLKLQEDIKPDLWFDLNPLSPKPGAIRTLGQKQLYDSMWVIGDDGKGYSKEIGYPNAQYYIQHAMMRALKMPMHEFGNDVLFLDTETLSAEHFWDTPPRDFFRLGQYAWGEGEVYLTEDFDEVIAQIKSARLVIGHNLIAYDLSYLLGDDAIHVPVFDTFVHASLVTPAPDRYLSYKGKVMLSNTPGTAMGFYSLANLSWTYGLDGKHGDLKEMAKKHNCDIGEIPMDDEFREYARQDIFASRDLARGMISVAEPTEYEWREQEVAQISAQISRNGFRVDLDRATARRDELLLRKEALVEMLVRDYDFPTKGKQPWRSNAGKEAILKILGPDAKKLPKTKGGAPSLGGDAVKAATAGTDNEELGEALAELLGQRSLAQLALDSVHDDGRVHPNITSLQRSRRFSVTEPGLTVWTTRGPGAVEKSYFVADSDDHVLVEMDYSAADARGVAAYSGDLVYMEEMTSEDFDAHEQAGRWLYGDKYDEDPKYYRQKSKPATHGYPYGSGAKKISMTLGVSVEAAWNFVNGMKAKYRLLALWMDRVREFGAAMNHVETAWGATLYTEIGRAYTQAPALLGQNATREVLVDGLIELRNAGLLRYLKITVHDAVVFSFPKDRALALAAQARQCLETEFKSVPFPVSMGQPSYDWQEAGH